MNKPTPVPVPTTADDGGAVAGEAALADAERKGFRLAVVGRTCALIALAAFYFVVFPWPNNIAMAAVFLATAAVAGLAGATGWIVSGAEPGPAAPRPLRRLIMSRI